MLVRAAALGGGPGATDRDPAAESTALGQHGGLGQPALRSHVVHDRVDEGLIGCFAGLRDIAAHGALALLAAPGARSLDGLARGNERVLERRSDAMPLDVGAPRPRGTDPAEHLGFDPARTGAVPAEHVVG